MNLEQIHNIKKTGIRLRQVDKEKKNNKEMINPFRKRNLEVKTFENYRSNTVYEETKRKTFLVENQKESKQYIVVKALTGKSIVLVVNAKIHK